MLQKLNSTEKGDITIENRSRKGCLTDLKMKYKSEVISGIQQYLHGSGTNDKDAVVLAKEEFQANVFSLQPEKGAFYHRNECHQVNRCVYNAGKCDKTI